MDQASLIKIYLRVFPLKIMRPHAHSINNFIEKAVSETDFAGKTLLDIGAENSPYKKMFKNLSYFSHDIAQNSENSINFIGDLNVGLPEIKDETFDYILCTQVLEHVQKPHIAFKEFARILKPNGKLFLTTHMVFDEHMVPNDFFRFTKYGLIKLGEHAELETEYIKPQGGVFLVFANILNELPIKLWFKRGSFGYFAYLVIFTLPIFVLNSLLYLLDALDKEKSLTTNYEVIYKK